VSFKCTTAVFAQRSTGYQASLLSRLGQLATASWLEKVLQVLQRRIQVNEFVGSGSDDTGGYKAL